MLITFDFKTVEEATAFLVGLKYTPQPIIKEFEQPIIKEFEQPIIKEFEQLTIKEFEQPIIKEFETGTAISPFDPTAVDAFDGPPAGGATPLEVKKKRGAKAKLGTEPPVGIEDCRKALDAIFSTAGRDGAKSVLAQFNASRISDLTPGQYREFIQACNQFNMPT